MANAFSAFLDNDPVITAQESFKAMLKEDIAPELREIGLKGSGQVYELPDAAFWALIGFQKSVRNDRNRVSFTLNLSVTRREFWAQRHTEDPGTYSVRPRANVDWGALIPASEYWFSRIGTFLPGGLDTWWEIAADEPTDLVAAEVTRVIREYGLPALRERMSETE